MPRVKRSLNAKKKRRKVLKLAKGYRGARGHLYKIATEAVDRALSYAFRDRKVRKREFRSLWIARISAAVEPLGLNYSRFVNCLKKAGIELNRKMISEIAINDPKGFEQLITKVRGAVSA